MKIVLLFLIIIGALFLGSFASTEHFTLSKVQGLVKECAAEGLLPAYMPQTCFRKNGTFNAYQNCKCRSKDGYCAICYPIINKVVGEELNPDLINTKPTMEITEEIKKPDTYEESFDDSKFDNITLDSVPSIIY